GKNPSKRNRKSQFDGLHRKLSAAGVAMQHRAKRSLGYFVFQDAPAIVVRFTGMDDERKAGGARGRNMGSEAALLRLARTMLVEIIEPGFAKRDHFGMLG